MKHGIIAAAIRYGQEERVGSGQWAGGVMGISDRDYMRVDLPKASRKKHAPGWWARLRFLLWRLVRRR
ncbi:MAG: hypothetical protein HN919_12635 [Verrucomicrobia bacterium]|nr:hypothetical protein [Verrucomicrobiota bacterium]MBT7702078.1 hypothetical protein [Verrucomicrobiota bacterium]